MQLEEWEMTEKNSVSLCGEKAIHLSYGPVTIHIDVKDLPALIQSLIRTQSKLATAGEGIH